MSLSGGGSRARKKARREEGYHKRELFLRVRNRENRDRPLSPVHSIDEVKRRSAACDGHFFDRDTLRFFGSRILSDVYPGKDPRVAYFVTSERRPRSNEGRFYTVRKLVGCRIKTVGQFQQYGSAGTAKRAAKKLAGG